MASIVVVGAGLGGLAAACHLRGRGHDVVVVERSLTAGGRAGCWQQDDFTFDTGPVVLTMPHILEDTFRAVGAEPSAYVALERLDPAYRACFWDGSELAVRADRETMAEEIRKLAGPVEAAGFHRFVDWVTELYRAEFPTFIDRDVASVRDLLAEPAQLARLVRLGGFRRLDHQVGRFFRDERLQRVFSFQALYAGLSPLRALALFAVIAYMDTVAGVYGVEGGLRAVPAGLANALAKAGADLRFGEEVIAIRSARRADHCTVTLAGGERIEADAVVVNADLPLAYPELLDTRPPGRVRRAGYSPSAMVWLLGTAGAAPPGAAQHNVHFGEPWAASFAELLDEGRPMRSPSRFVSLPSRVGAIDNASGSANNGRAAPPGHEAVYILEPVPNLTADLDWPAVQRRLTERTERFARTAGYLHGEPVVRRVVGPPQWRADGLARGTPFSLDHRFTQSGPFRPSLSDRRLPRITFTGSATRPGVGVPMVLISGRLAADRVEAGLHG